MRDESLTLDEIKGRLADDAHSLAVELFGKPTKENRATVFFGNNQSVSVGVSGKYAGRFRSWEADENGSMLDAIMFAYGCSFREAVDHAKAWLGIDDDRPLPPRPPRKAPVIDVDRDEKRKEAEAKAIWESSGPIYGTPGEAYLKGRAISSPLWPDAVRWHKGGYLVFASTTREGNVSQIQRIYINRNGTPKKGEDGKKIKRSLGPSYGGSVRFAGTQEALCLAEGPETGLSVWWASGYETWVSLGGIRADLADVPLNRPIYICKDDDKKNAPSRKGLLNKIRQWRREGRKVLDFLPFDLSRRSKGDFNDALQEYGPGYVRQRLKPSNNIPLESVSPLSLARQELDKTISESLDEFSKLDGETAPPVHCFKVGLGIGKTETAIKQAIQWIKAGRGPVVYAVPSHDLSGDLLGRMESLIDELADGGISAAVWKGRGWKPKDPDSTEPPMCRNYDNVKTAQRLGMNVQEHICRAKDAISGTVQKCKYFDDCPYQKQKDVTANIRIVAHHLLFNVKPSEIGKPSLLVIDESFYQAGLRGTGNETSIIVSENQIKAIPLHGHHDRSPELSADLDTTLGKTRRKLVSALNQLENGPLPLETLVSSGLTADECLKASKAEWLRLRPVLIYPGMKQKDFNERTEKAFINAEVSKMAMMWRELASFLNGDFPLSGRLSLEDIADKKEKTKYRGIRLKGKADIDPNWLAPTLHIDATMRMDLVKPYFPQAELKADISAEAPHQHVTQYHDKTFSKTSLFKNQRQIDGLWSWIKATAISKGGNWLVVVQKAIEEQIRQRHVIPPFISIAHHNNVAGIDSHKDVTGVICVGRTQAPPIASENIAAALTGEYIPPASEDGWYPSRTDTVRSKDGLEITIEVDQHPHALAEQVRASICEDQLWQIIGRPRGVSRTEENPVEIIVLGNVPFITPDTLKEWRPVSADERMLGEGIWFENSEHAVKAFPILKSAGNIRFSRKEAKIQSVSFPYIDILIRKTNALESASYQRAGARQKKQIIIYDKRLFPDAKAYLERLVGELAFFEVDTPVPEPIEAPIEALDEWCGGVMPSNVALDLRATMRATGVTQQGLADICGLSRPHVTNALQGRFGLAPEIVQNIKRFLSSPPPIIQESLF